MKSYQIFLSLIIFFLLSSLTCEQEQEESRKINLADNEMRLEFLSTNESLILNFYQNHDESTYYIRLLSLSDSNIKIESPNLKLQDKTNKTEKMFEIPIKSSDFDESNGFINVTVTQNNTLIEISSVVLKNTTGGIYAYQSKEHSVDQEEQVDSNNFIIFLSKEQEYKKFDMKFKFNSNEVIGKTATFGFICLPNKNREYIALAKFYKNKGIGNLTSITIEKTEFEKEVINQYIKEGDKEKRETYKPELAFIFSVDMDKKQSFSYSINSEIINVFLIVSIVIALVFAVITFFLIRRKQSAESTNIEGNENLLKGDKEEGEGKGEKGENEKEEKEGGEEKEDKEDKIINDDNAEQEQKKIEAAEN